MSEVLRDCPGCKKLKLSWNTDKDIGWCFYCKKTYWEMDPIKGSKYDFNPLPNVYLREAFSNPEAISYFSYRRAKIPPDTMFDETKKEIYLPIWCPSKEYSPSWIRRSISPKGHWSTFKETKAEHYLYGYHEQRKAVVVEGIFDALRIGPGAVSIIGTSLTPTKLVWLKNNCDQIVVWLDPDKAGRHCVTQIKKSLSPYIPCFNVEYFKEPDECKEGNEVLTAVRSWIKEDDNFSLCTIEKECSLL